MAVDLLITGISARAAAFSAVRAGLRVAAADRFADRDLQAVCKCVHLPDWPNGVTEWAARFPPSVPVLPAGGLENEPRLAAELAASRPLLMPDEAALGVLRDPFALQGLWRDCGIPTARTISFSELNGDPPPASVHAGPWLRKRIRSGGGCHVQPIDRGQPAALEPDEYLQERLSGWSGGAAFLTRGGQTELLGVTRDLASDQPLAPFAYTGSVCVSEEAVIQAVERLGQMLSRQVRLAGLWGLDFIWQPEEGRCIPLEVNPRYCAGMEALELQSGRSFVGKLLGRIGTPRAGLQSICMQSISIHANCIHANCIGKRIVYAPAHCIAPSFAVPSVTEIKDGTYSVADIPAEGTGFLPGEPICTVIARGQSTAEVLDHLLTAEKQVAEAMAGDPPDV